MPKESIQSWHEISIYSSKSQFIDTFSPLSHFPKHKFYSQFKAFNATVFWTWVQLDLIRTNFELNMPKDFGDDDFLYRFDYLNESSIKSFFNSQLVDVPLCFKKSKSLYSQTFEMPRRKLTNILMRSGRKSLVRLLIGRVFIRFIRTFFKITRYSQVLRWSYMHYITDFLHLTSDSSLANAQWGVESPLSRPYNGYFSESTLTIPKRISVEKYILKGLKPYNPLFSFYIRKLDKGARRNTRGKVGMLGKYVIIWKYVPTYKRIYVSLRWLLRDLRFQKSHFFIDRFFKILETFFLTPQKTFLARFRRFIHGHVFYSYKKTLLKTLKSVS